MNDKQTDASKNVEHFGISACSVACADHGVLFVPSVIRVHFKLD